MSDYGLIDEQGPADFKKTPDEAITVLFHWAKRLDGDTIASATYELPDGLTNEADSESGTIAKVRVSGGTDGKIYRVISKITGTTTPNDYEWVKRVKVVEP